ncbi:MAG: NADH-quinone oxidoreductase subunit C [Magnetococcales bacterium]|nr:NADH-quinone oxidoreductase subunit C [Magnetococcales bacterium]
MSGSGAGALYWSEKQGARLDRLEQLLALRYSHLTRERRRQPLNDALILHVEAAQLRETMRLLHDDAELDFKLLIDLAGVHYPDRARPLEVVYQLLSVHHNHRLRVKVALDEGDVVPSMTVVWGNASWYEREVYEMFGILFSGHPDLRRLLTDYDFDGYPLRKDFPVEGRVEVRYDPGLKRVVQEPTQLSVPNREFYGRQRS